MPETAGLPQRTERRRNWAPWVGLLLALAAMLSNGVYFLGLPGERALPILGVALVIAALVCAAAGILRTFRQPQRYGGKISSSILGVVSLLLCGLAAFTSMHSRDLPEATGAPQVGQKVPDFTLADTKRQQSFVGTIAGQKRRVSASPFRDRRKYRQRRQSERSRNAAQGPSAGFLSWLLVTILQPRVTRHPEKPERV
jgi:hypothetical protein